MSCNVKKCETSILERICELDAANMICSQPYTISTIAIKSFYHPMIGDNEDFTFVGDNTLTSTDDNSFK